MRKVSAFILAAALLPGMALAETTNQRQGASQAITATNHSSITAISDIKRGSTVTVQGTVERILDTDEFRLADESGDIVVYIGWKNVVPVDVGEQIAVKGFVDDDLFLELYAREIIHGDGRVTQLQHSG